MGFSNEDLSRAKTQSNTGTNSAQQCRAWESIVTCSLLKQDAMKRKSNAFGTPSIQMTLATTASTKQCGSFELSVGNGERTKKKFGYVSSGQRKVRDSNKLAHKLDNVIVHFRKENFDQGNLSETGN